MYVLREFLVIPLKKMLINPDWLLLFVTIFSLVTEVIVFPSFTSNLVTKCNLKISYLHNSASILLYRSDIAYHNDPAPLKIK